MKRDDYVKRARRVFSEPRVLEEAATFQAALAELACTGLQWGGGLGILGVVIMKPSFSRPSTRSSTRTSTTATSGSTGSPTKWI